MGAKQSSQTKRGIKLIKEGMSYYAAAKKVGVSPSTLYRALPKPVTFGSSNFDPRYFSLVDGKLIWMDRLEIIGTSK